MRSGVDRFGVHCAQDRHACMAHVATRAVLAMQVRMLQDPSWKDALVGKERDFPELATSLQAGAAAIAYAIRCQGLGLFPRSGVDRLICARAQLRSGVDRRSLLAFVVHRMHVKDKQFERETHCWRRMAEWFDASHAAAWTSNSAC